MIIILKFKVLASYTLVMVALILLKDPTRVINTSTPYLHRYHLKKVIEEAIDLSKHPLTDKQIEEISESFKQHMNN